VRSCAIAADLALSNLPGLQVAVWVGGKGTDTSRKSRGGRVPALASWVGWGSTFRKSRGGRVPGLAVRVGRGVT
jgi:hypothetical protein